MKTKSSQIKDLRSLQLEKSRLKMQQEIQAQKLEAQYYYLKTNYRSMLWKAVNPFEDKDSTLSQVLNIAKNTVLPGIPGLGTSEQPQTLYDVAGILAAKLIKRLLRKKQAKNDTEKVKSPE